MNRSKEEVEGQLFSSLYSKEIRSQIHHRYLNRFKTSKILEQLKMEATLWDGRRVWLEMSNSLIDASSSHPLQLTVLRDVTEKELMQKVTQNTERIRSLGTLAGGIAHDLNNALAPITMSLDLLRAKVPDCVDLIETMETSAKHGAYMVKQLLTFSKGADGQRIPIKPMYLLKEMEQIIKSTFPKNIELRVSHHPSNPTILGDDTQLHQVLLNLCVNARDAMPNGGTLWIESDCIHIDETFDTGNGKLAPGPCFVWRVRDNGPGMSSDVLKHIFDPFFTTKDCDQGTGLGLSILMGVVKSHGGLVRVESEEGKGACFSVFIPVIDDALEAQPEAKNKEASGKGIKGNQETILVVDDEDSVRTILKIVLKQLNYKVITAKDGVEGLEIASKFLDEINLIITDNHMPRMDGLAMIRALRDMAPEIDVIVASGRVEPGMEKDFLDLGVREILCKPYNQAALKSALTKVFSN